MGRPATAAIAVACGAVAACLYLGIVLGSSGALILVYMTQLPLFVAGLWLGAGAAAIAGGSGVLVLLVANDLLGAAIFAALNAGPVTLLVRQALLARRRSDGSLAWYPPGLLAAWLTGLALTGIAAAVLVTADALAGPGSGSGSASTSSSGSSPRETPSIEVPSARSADATIQPEIGIDGPVHPSPLGSVASRGIEMLHGVDMEVTVELGRTRMTVRDLLALSPGAVLELDRAAGSPADLLVNGRLIARGEVVVVDEDFGLRVTEILDDTAVV